MKITIHIPSAIFGALILGLVAIVASAQGVTSSAIAPEVQETIRAKRVEIVDDEGEVCVLLYGSQTGGVVEWRRPGRTVKGEQEPIFAHIGSYFPGYADFRFGDPTGDSEVGLSMSIGGMPQSGVLSMTGLKGEVLRVDTWPLRPTVTVKDPKDGSIKFQK